MFWEVVRVGLEDVAKTFGISENLYEKYVVGEIQKNELLKSLIKKRDGGEFDWTKETPLGGAGTTLNGVVLYCLIRHYSLAYALETGVSGGYYTGFMLEALNKNGWDKSCLISLELSDDMTKIGHLLGEEFHSQRRYNVMRPTSWALTVGKDSLETLRNGTVPNHYSFEPEPLIQLPEIFSHDSLHTMSHMLKELQEFKKSNRHQFFVFIDDEKSDNFWQRCLQSGAFKKPGYDVKWISGAESRLRGHLGGFIQYVKS